MRLAQSILKSKFPSVNKPLKKGLWKNISPRAYFQNFTVAKKIIVQMWLAQHKYIVHTYIITLLIITKIYLKSNLIAYQPSWCQSRTV